MQNKRVINWKNGWAILFLHSVLCLGALGMGTLFSWVGQSKMITTISKQVISKTAPKQIFKEKDTLTMLLLGCDEERAPGGKKITVESARSDSMLVLKFDFKQNKLTGVSIPRDLLVAVPGYRSHKINAYHKFGGNDLSKKAVSHVLGISIDRVISLNTHIFQEMVDMVGGIDINVEKRMKWTDKAGDLYINLHPGFQHLNGYNAMCFVRYRYGDSDHHRQQRQKQFLLAFRDKVAQNVTLLPKLADKAQQIVGDDFSTDEIASLVLFAARLGGENIRMGIVPTYVGGHYWLKIDERKLASTLKEFNLINPS